jgi:hypothetical protein
MVVGFTSTYAISAVPEMDGRPVAKYLIQATKSCSKLGSHWPNKKRLGDCLKDR